MNVEHFVLKIREYCEGGDHVGVIATKDTDKYLGSLKGSSICLMNYGSLVQEMLQGTFYDFVVIADINLEDSQKFMPIIKMAESKGVKTLILNHQDDDIFVDANVLNDFVGDQPYQIDSYKTFELWMHSSIDQLYYTKNSLVLEIR